MALRLLPAVLAVSAAEPSFEEWCAEYQQCNFNGPDEEQKRRAIFDEHKTYVEKVNGEQSSFKLALNKFAILTVDELPTGAIKSLVPESDANMPVLGKIELGSGALARDVDWQQSGFVTPVKNQGQCGSCWAFATTGAVESAYSVNAGAYNFVSASEQQLVDCSGSVGNAGCAGGWPHSAFQYQQGAGVCSEDSYPYTAADGQCNDGGCQKLPFGVAGYQTVPAYNEDALRAALNQAPVAVTVYADNNFQMYSTGVLQGGCDAQINHAVLAVGYGPDFFKLKNSWGADWGWAGYILVASGNNAACLVSQDSAMPQLAMSVDV